MSDTDIDTDPNAETGAVGTEQFDQADAAGAGALAGDPIDQDLRRLGDVPLEMSVEIGRTQMTVGDTLDLRAGSIVTLDRLAGEPVDLLVNGTPIARGEVVVVDEQFGLRVTEILEGDGSAPSQESEPDVEEEA
jgi:flagellar motor switch protein FliN/FliY